MICVFALITMGIAGYLLWASSELSESGIGAVVIARWHLWTILLTAVVTFAAGFWRQRRKPQ